MKQRLIYSVLIILTLISLLGIIGCAPTVSTSTSSPTASTTSQITTTPTTPTTVAGPVVLTVKGTQTKTYTMDQLKALPVTSGYGGTKNKAGTITAPAPFKGVALTELLTAAGGFTATTSVKATASDGFTKTLTYDQITKNTFNVYDLTGNSATWTTTPIILLAYELNGQALDSSVGPLELIILTGQSQLTDNSNFAKMVTTIEIIPAGGTTATTTAVSTPPKPASPDVILATTTSTADTGLLDAILPMFTQKTGYIVKPIAVGTGQAITMGQRGEADVVLAHSPELEKPFVDSGVGINGKLVMHNYFIIVGPAADPAGISGMKSAADAFKKIAGAKAIFMSRGDKSGTDTSEKGLWTSVGIDPKNPPQSWYQETGQGMGNTLNIASEKGGYTYTDYGTFLKLNKTLALKIMVEGDPSLINIYHVYEVNPVTWPKVNADGAKAFCDFLVSPEIQKFIETFGAAQYGLPFFIPDAGKTEAQLASK